VNVVVQFVVNIATVVLKMKCVNLAVKLNIIHVMMIMTSIIIDDTILEEILSLLLLFL
jgi:hypothetical protein